MNLIENIGFPLPRGIISSGIGYGIEILTAATPLGRVIAGAAFEMSILYKYQQIFTNYVLSKKCIKDTIDNYFPEKNLRGRQFREIAGYSTTALQLTFAASVTYATGLYFGTALTLGQLFKVGGVVIAFSALCEFGKSVANFIIFNSHVIRTLKLFNEYDNNFLQDLMEKYSDKIFIDLADFERIKAAAQNKLDEIANKQMDDESEKLKTDAFLSKLGTNQDHALEYTRLLEKF